MSEIKWTQVWRDNGANEIVKTDSSYGNGYHVYPDAAYHCQGVFDTLDEAKEWFEVYLDKKYRGE